MSEEPQGQGAGYNAPRPKSPWPKRLVILVVLAAAIGGAAWYYLSRKPGLTATQFRTVTITRGDIVQEITANGSLTPVKQVEVGSQVSGIIEKILVDFNSKVKQDQLLARIDPSTYQKNVAQAKAQLAVAKANLELAEVNAHRADQLFKDKLISAAEHDTAVASYHSAQASVQIQEASVERANVDLGYTQIKAPIDGVVISRAVDEGQTVASSFNTPRLFVIANDLTKMQIEAAVSEADVGGVEEGERVSFSVDAFPNRKFVGQVQQVRFAPITNQNVVTYTAVIHVDNPDYKLRPGMTATAKIVTAEKNGVLRAPNSALRFRPPPGAIVLSATNSPAGGATNQAAVVTDSSGMPIPPWRAESRRPNPGEREKWEASLTPEQREKFQQSMQQMRQRFAEGGGGPGGGGPGATARAAKPEGPTIATAYLMLPPEGNAGKDAPVTLKPVTVKAGVTDGLFTEILDGLREGDVVVAGTAVSTNSAAAPPQNPFSPFGGRPGPRR
jgi:HlyD family secretion protein